MFNNLYSVGPHTGQSNFVPTSMESAVENAMNLINELKSPIKLKKGLTLREMIFYVIGLVLLGTLVYIILKN